MLVAKQQDCLPHERLNRSYCQQQTSAVTAQVEFYLSEPECPPRVRICHYTILIVESRH